MMRSARAWSASALAGRCPYLRRPRIRRASEAIRCTFHSDAAVRVLRAPGEQDAASHNADGFIDESEQLLEALTFFNWNAPESTFE